MLIDLTGQDSDPACLEFVVLKVPARPVVQITAEPGYFFDIPFSIRVPGQLLMACNSNTWISLERCYAIDVSTKYAFSKDGKKMQMLETERKPDISVTASFDLTKLLHPNWGAWYIRFAGIVLGEQAIVKHIENWKQFFASRKYMSDSERTFYLKFLQEFQEDVQHLVQVPARN